MTKHLSLISNAIFVCGILAIIVAAFMLLTGCAEIPVKRTYSVEYTSGNEKTGDFQRGASSVTLEPAARASLAK